MYDHHLRSFTPEEQAFLQDLAAIIIDDLELRLMILHWKQAQEYSEFQSRHDALTGLPNRMLLLDRAEQAYSRPSITARPSVCWSWICKVVPVLRTSS
ncbi:hypothetical protein ACFSC4_20820 [Deinococcus malanensis]|uniref:hypothetical protein n=1 Tax=Deinococcus malanensis TaxID=1706855 RepID=UPI00362A9407